MRVGILIQARMSSRRLPGKVLMDLAGRPLLGYVVARARMVKDASLVAVATSSEPSDDPIAAFVDSIGVDSYRGPLDDVAARFLGAAEAFGLDAFVRVNADSPLLDPRLIERGIALYRDGGADLATNVLRRTYPAGMSVEVLNRECFAKAYGEMNTEEEREHVTLHYYRHPERFRIRSFEAPQDFSDRTLAIDTQEDFARIARIIGAMDRPHGDYACEDIIGLAEMLDIFAQRADHL